MLFLIWNNLLKMHGYNFYAKHILVIVAARAHSSEHEALLYQENTWFFYQI